MHAARIYAVNEVHSVRRERLPTRHASSLARDVESTAQRADARIWASGTRSAANRAGMVVATANLMHSSNTRGKAAFMPWMAALVIGATAHGGWLIHELRHADARPLIVEVQAPKLERHERTHTRIAARCRHAPSEIPTTEPPEDVDLWVQQTARRVYAIDRRLFDHLDPHALERLQSLGGAFGAVELRNIRRGTLLYLLGLRNGDRLLAIATRGQPEIEWITVTIARRGHPLALVYEII
jgi:hypothetical protein